ncbi:MAG TPA: glycosyltransferase [Devosiaceae bacterium]|nr:glycosyltransferase [Devosiaceae bacterium]
MSEASATAAKGELPSAQQSSGPSATRRTAPRITYFSLSFPELTQTFVFNEMRHLKALGADIDIVALRPPRNEMSDLPQRYGFGERIAYADPGVVVRNRTQRIGLAGRSAARLVAAGRGDGVWRLLRSGADSQSLTRSMNLHIAARLRARGAEGDVLLCHFGPAGRVAAHLKAMGLIKAPLVTVFHGYDVTQYLDDKSPAEYRELFQSADLLIAISDLWHRRLLELGAPPEKIETLHLGIDCSAFEYRPRRIEPGEPIRFVSVGRMTEKKGHRYTVEAFAELASRHPELDLKLDIAGSGPLFDELQGLVNRLGLSQRVRLLGGINHDEVRRLLDAAHIFVLHSVTAGDGDMEGIPVSIMEAMAMGLPVASTLHSGIPELVADGRSGLLVAERDAQAFADALGRLIGDPALVEGMGRDGRAIIERDYNADLQAERLLGRLSEISR